MWGFRSWERAKRLLAVVVVYRGWRYVATVWGLRHGEALNGVANGCYGVATLLHEGIGNRDG